MPTTEAKAVLAALRKFADAVKAKLNTLTAGEPEDQLRAPFETLMQEVGQALHRQNRMHRRDLASRPARQA